ncbi:hypothetical protein [Brachybacterium sp. YJGR34]|uniref:hypothetical protein n=1 Tax=Brachybacterium sp. YJGR34 TaxID=2059911 RepID=UPI000E0B7219|nr:hypothetical protein [Brachybacterium sp. YJGR34]
MTATTPAGFPTRLPEVHVDLLEECTSQVVTCDELQWWFVIPRVGEATAAAWYDRATAELTAVRRTRRPASAVKGAAGDVLIEIEESTYAPEDWRGVGRRDIRFTARLGPHRAEFLSVEQAGIRTDVSAPDFAANWCDSLGRTIRESGRVVTEGPRTVVTVAEEGARVDLVDLTVDGVTRRCVRVLDIAPGAMPSEFGQAIIDLETGRTLAYWQYRPETWDDDAPTWLAEHPGVDLTIDGVRYQRRNCTGRDEIALTDHALALR